VRPSPQWTDYSDNHFRRPIAEGAESEYQGHFGSLLSLNASSAGCFCSTMTDWDSGSSTSSRLKGDYFGLRSFHNLDQPLRIHLVGISENGSESIESSTLVNHFSTQKSSIVGLTSENQFSEDGVLDTAGPANLFQCGFSLNRAFIAGRLIQHIFLHTLSRFFTEAGVMSPK
jgi:hypothetical protein